MQLGKIIHLGMATRHWSVYHIDWYELTFFQSVLLYIDLYLALRKQFYIRISKWIFGKNKSRRWVPPLPGGAIWWKKHPKKSCDTVPLKRNVSMVEFLKLRWKSWKICISSGFFIAQFPLLDLDLYIEYGSRYGSRRRFVWKDPPGSRTMNKIIFTIFMTCSKDGLVSKVKTNIQKIFGTEQH